MITGNLSSIESAADRSTDSENQALQNFPARKTGHENYVESRSPHSSTTPEVYQKLAARLNLTSDSEISFNLFLFKW